MATITAFENRRSGRSGAAKPLFAESRGAIGAVLFLLVAFFLFAAGAVTGAPQASGAPVEAGAFILDPSVGSARA